MAKVKEAELNGANIFEETIKAVLVAKHLEEEAAKELPDRERLRMLELNKEHINSAEEEEAMEKEEIRLKRKLRFPVIEVIGVPEDKRETVQRNYEVEKEEADRVLTKKYNRLNELAEYVQETTHLLNELIILEDKKATAQWIEDVLAGVVTKNPGKLNGLRSHLSFLTQFSKGHGLKRVREQSEKLAAWLAKYKK